MLEALRKGFTEIGFSAHLPKVKDPDPYHAMLESDLPAYVDLVLSLRSKYEGRITIKLGTEADYFEGYEEETRRLIEKHPFDYVFGSVHFIGDWHFTSRAGLDRYKTEDPDTAYREYFSIVEKMIGSGLFDIVAHPDAIYRDGFKPGYSLRREYRRVAAMIGEMDMAVEVNTGGIRRGAGSVYPTRQFLETCIEHGLPLILGSDAHAPVDVGRDFDKALKLLKGLGVSEISTYQRRKRKSRPLPDHIVPDES